MKNLLLSIMALLAFTSIFAQSPSGFNYQAVVRDGDGEVLKNQPVGIRMTLFQGSASGTMAYQESFIETTNDFGLINLVIGEGNNVSGDLSLVDWSDGPYFLETAIDLNAGSNYTVLGTNQLLSVPYAMYSASSASDGQDGTDGQDGASAYEVWLSQGNTGSEADFLVTLNGQDGEDGASAYQIWLDEGNSGSMADFIASLKGEPGQDGQDGEGLTPQIQAEIDANTAKVGITPEQSAAIETNSAKVGITEGQAVAINTNTEKVGITEEQAIAIETNSEKVGITEGQAVAIEANSEKVGITEEQATAIDENTEKVGITEEQAVAIEANSDKVGITEEQAVAIEANTEKVGITEEQATAIEANSEKVGITTEQSDAINANTAKVGITEEQAAAIETNSADPDTDETNEIQDLEVISNTLRITGNEAATQISLGGQHYVGDIKHSFTMEDHGGWYRLDGDPLSGLPETAQAAANSLGIFGSLPDARDRFLKGNADGQANATTGGSLNLTQSNLPNFSMTGTAEAGGNHNHGGVTLDYTPEDEYGQGAHQHSFNDLYKPTSSVSVNTGVVGGATTNVQNDNSNTTTSNATTVGTGVHWHAIANSGTHTHTANVSGGGTSADYYQPFLSANVFIYLGETSLNDLIALGQDNQEIMYSGISPATMVNEGLLTLENLVDPTNPTVVQYNYTNSNNMGASEPVTLQVLVDQGFDLGTLYSIYDYDLLSETGVTTLTLFNAGITIAEMANDTDKVGIDLSEFASDMVPIADLYASGLYSLSDLDLYFNAASMLTIATVAELLNEDGTGTDITVQELYSGGASASDFYGVNYQKGLIFYTESNGLTYVAQATDQSSGIIWAADGGGVSTNENLGSGSANTDNMIAYDAGSNAASVCRDLGPEWFLPSIDELSEMYSNLHLNNLGSFNTDKDYWSSHDQGSNSRAGSFSMVSGSGGQTERVTLLYVRAIKSFISAPE